MNEILYSYGYQYDFKKNTVRRIRELKNTEFFMKNSYKKIIYIIKRLKKPYLNIFLTVVCDAIKNDKEIKKFIKSQMSSSEGGGNVGFLEYNNNSCYKDCVLMALFMRKNPVIKRAFFRGETELQQKLYEIYTDIHHGKRTSCKNTLDKLLKTYKNYNFGKKEMNDASEFLYFLFSEMKFEPVKKDTVSFLTNFMKRKKLYERKILCGPIDSIPRSFIKDSYTIDEALEKKELSKLETPKDGFEFTIRIEKIIFAPYLVFHVERKYVNEKYEELLDFSPVSFSEEIIVDRSLFLHAIILFEDKHYTALLKGEDDTWYFYDDMNEEMQELGSFKNMVKRYGKFAETHGVLFFYS